MYSHGTIFGIITFISTIGGSIGPFIAGIIFDLRNSYTYAFLLCLATTFIGLTLIIFLNED
jgi:MFS family permease